MLFGIINITQILYAKKKLCYICSKVFLNYLILALPSALLTNTLMVLTAFLFNSHNTVLLLGFLFIGVSPHHHQASEKTPQNSKVDILDKNHIWVRYKILKLMDVW
ncbi:hypothetical protein BPADB04_50230 [Bacillus paranthracis]|nr:hypothetical protein BPADB04_50230 [Bacillus paranthracis]